MKTAPKPTTSPKSSGVSRAASKRKATSSNRTRQKPHHMPPKSAHTGSRVNTLNPVDPLACSKLKSVVRHFAEQETEALALKTVQLAKRGHPGALAFVLESLNDAKPETGSRLMPKLGSITRLDEIADAQRIVIASATDGAIKPSDAIHYMKMLNELGDAIKNSELQAEIDELRSYIHGA